MHPYRATFLLVPGAWHGAWAWKKLIPILELAGHQVLAPDLPGLGQDRTPLSAITFAAYVNCILDLIDRAKEPVILVGHGFSGMLISQVAEERPEKIRWLTYLAALLPCNGETTLTMLTGQEHPLFTCVEVEDLSMRLQFDAACPLWYHDCSPTDMLLAERFLKQQALLPMGTPVLLSQRFEKVPRVYLACTYDRILTPPLQTRLFTITRCEHVIWLPSGHAPFFSIPTHLAAQLNRLAKNASSGARDHAP